jgi:hypothetical protein
VTGSPVRDRSTRARTSAGAERNGSAGDRIPGAPNWRRALLPQDGHGSGVPDSRWSRQISKPPQLPHT